MWLQIKLFEISQQDIRLLVKEFFQRFKEGIFDNIPEVAMSNQNRRDGKEEEEEDD